MSEANLNDFSPRQRRMTYAMLAAIDAGHVRCTSGNMIVLDTGVSTRRVAAAEIEQLRERGWVAQRDGTFGLTDDGKAAKAVLAMLSPAGTT